MLLRTAIGWHFLYEGVHKINTTPSQRDSWAGVVLTKILPTPHDKDKDVEPPFSAEGYLRNATGPLAPRFRAMVPDVNSFAKLDRDSDGLPSRLKKTWQSELGRIEKSYRFTDEQKAAAEKELALATAKIDAWFLSQDNAEKIKKYYRDLKRVEELELSPDSLPYQRTLGYKDRADVEKERRELVAAIDGEFSALKDKVGKLATDDQRANAKAISAPWTQLDVINLTTMWGLALVGLCLMLGLFTPLAALAAAAYLMMFYLSMPPWPGLPVGKGAEGHYLYVNKNLIEFFACLVLATTPNGHWLGLDALLFGRRARRRALERTRVVAEGEAPLASNVAPAQSGRSGQTGRRPNR